MNLSPFLYGLSELIGEANTLKIVQRYGGITLYVPKTITEKHDLARLIGLAAAQALCDAYPGEKLSIALHETGSHVQQAAERRKAIRELDGSGLTHAQIARQLRTTERTVRKVLGTEVDDRQRELF